MNKIWDRVEKRIGKEGLERLSKMTVAIVGQGSLGGHVSVMLAKSGVGGFVLVDKDRLSAQNVVRHVADRRYVGRLKVKAVADLIFFRNPKAKVRTVSRDALVSLRHLVDADLVIVAGLGSEAVQQRLGREIRRLGKPILVGGVHGRGYSGEVSYIDPQNGPCYACFSSAARVMEPAAEGEFDYAIPPDQVKAEPALGVHIERVAEALADWALRLLISDPTVMAPPPGNMLWIANEPSVIGQDKEGRPVKLLTQEATWLSVEKLAGCLICGQDLDVNIGLSVDQLLTTP